MRFQVVSKFQPTGDQGEAINKLSKGVLRDDKFQTLWGVTGSGKTYVMAKIIEKTQLPTLIISPNKTLAAQLYEEFRTFFPENKVSYFVSYYDYYQPEAYLPNTDTYIEKDAKINEDIDQMRHAAVQNLLSRNDSIIVASVSAIYNLGKPDSYKNFALNLKVGEALSQKQIMYKLVELQFERNDYELWRGKFRLRHNYLDIWPSGQDEIIRIKNTPEAIESIEICPAPFGEFKKVKDISLFPAKFWISEREKTIDAMKEIAKELENHTAKLKKDGKFLEAERIKRRTEYDMAMMRETGWCHGIENYSRQLEGRKPGTPPYTLLDYFPKNFLLFLDESHIGVPQLHGMYEGDQSRKKTLVEYGFRLPSALDNRPLKYNEFMGIEKRTIYVSATPGDYERSQSTQIVEQIIRPTYLLDPEVEVRKTEGQVEDLVKEIEIRQKKNQRVLVLTLTKKMAEALSSHLKEKKIRTNYLHSDVKTFERTKTLADLRRGKYEVLVGINLLREGLDLPEVSLIAILDADKEGFLRNETSLVQIMGRAARHEEGRVIMYADSLTKSIKAAMETTNQRRQIQLDYNKKHHVKPRPIVKVITDIFRFEENEKALPKKEFLKEYLHKLKNQLDLARRNLQFDKAASIAEKIKTVKAKMEEPPKE